MSFLPARNAFIESELHVKDIWYLRTTLADLLGVPVERATDSRLYRTLDRALPLKAKIELALEQRIGGLFSVEFEILLYDVTSTYFEGLETAHCIWGSPESGRYPHHVRGREYADPIWQVGSSNYGAAQNGGLQGLPAR